VDFKRKGYAKLYLHRITVELSRCESPLLYGIQDGRSQDRITFDQTTQYITTRMRGGLISMTFSGNDLGSFARLGYVRYRYSPQGRR